MRVLLPNRRQIQRISALLLCWVSAVSLAVELKQLHLPKSYLRYLPQMLDGGKLMAASERCATFLSGELSLDKSQLDHPVFIYTCRDPNQRTYSLLVDGLTHEILDASRPSGRVSFTQLQAEIDRQRAEQRAREEAEAAAIAALQRERAEVERQRQEELERQERERQRLEEIARRERQWQNCRALLTEKTANMLEVVWLTQSQPPAETLSEGQGDADGEGENKDENNPPEPHFRFAVDFNAVDPHGTALAYRAYCVFDNEGEEPSHHSIHPRVLEERKAREQASKPLDTDMQVPSTVD